MALPLIPIAAAGALGFGGGFLASDGITKLIRLGLILGVGYVVYTQVNK